MIAWARSSAPRSASVMPCAVIASRYPPVSPTACGRPSGRGRCGGPASSPRWRHWRRGALRPTIAPSRSVTPTRNQARRARRPHRPDGGRVAHRTPIRSAPSTSPKPGPIAPWIGCRRAEGEPRDGAFRLDHPAERGLALELLGFSRAVRTAAEALHPHRLCSALFALASTFTAFYEACPVLRAETPGSRASRRHLCALTGRVLQHGLGMLGIRAPGRM